MNDAGLSSRSLAHLSLTRPLNKLAGDPTGQRLRSVFKSTQRRLTARIKNTFSTSRH